MDDALPVGVGEAAGGLEAHDQGLGGREAVPPVEQAPQAAPTEVLGHQPGDPVPVLSPVVDGQDVGVAEGGGGLGLGPEPAEELLVAGQARVQELHRHLALEAHVVGQERLGRAALPQGLDQLVAATEDPPDLCGHLVPHRERGYRPTRRPARGRHDPRRRRAPMPLSGPRCWHHGAAMDDDLPPGSAPDAEGDLVLHQPDPAHRTPRSSATRCPSPSSRCGAW